MSAGIGVEIGASVVRAVRLDADGAGALVTSGELRRAPGPHGLIDALIRVAVALDAPAGIEVRLAWFPVGASVEARDITGHHPADVAATLAQWSDGGHGGAVVSDGRARRWVTLIRWTPGELAQLERSAAQAGLGHATCEPSPIAVARLAAGWDGAVVRDDADGAMWRADVVDGAVRRAAASAVTSLPDAAATVGLVPAVVGRAWSPSIVPPGDDAGGERALTAEGTWHLADPDRDVVAFGAAVGAAGLAGVPRPIHLLGPADGGAGWQRWAVERIADDAVVASPESTRRWVRRLARRRAVAEGGRR